MSSVESVASAAAKSAPASRCSARGRRRGGRPQRRPRAPEDIVSLSPLNRAKSGCARRPSLVPRNDEATICSLIDREPERAGARDRSRRTSRLRAEKPPSVELSASMLVPLLLALPSHALVARVPTIVPRTTPVRLRRPRRRRGPRLGKGDRRHPAASTLDEPLQGGGDRRRRRTWQSASVHSPWQSRARASTRCAAPSSGSSSRGRRGRCSASSTSRRASPTSQRPTASRTSRRPTAPGGYGGRRFRRASTLWTGAAEIFGGAWMTFGAAARAARHQPAG